jgi:hypothetical protein
MLSAGYSYHSEVLDNAGLALINGSYAWRSTVAGVLNKALGPI